MKSVDCMQRRTYVDWILGMHNLSNKIILSDDVNFERKGQGIGLVQSYPPVQEYKQN